MPYRIVFLLVPLALAIAWLIWSSTRAETFTSVPRRVKIGVIVVLTAVLAQQSYMEYRWIATERTITDAIKPFTGTGMTVHCQRLTEALFYVSDDRGRVEMRPDGRAEPRAMLSWQTCRDIRDWLGSDRQHPSLEQITALHIAAHEAMHLRGDFSEGRAECEALALDPAIAESLGAQRDVALHMARRYRNEVYPNLASDYQSGDCPAV